jgi:hypothetical protein
LAIIRQRDQTRGSNCFGKCLDTVAFLKAAEPFLRLKIKKYRNKDRTKLAATNIPTMTPAMPPSVRPRVGCIEGEYVGMAVGDRSVTRGARAVTVGSLVCCCRMVVKMVVLTAVASRDDRVEKSRFVAVIVYVMVTPTDAARSLLLPGGSATTEVMLMLVTPWKRYTKATVVARPISKESVWTSGTVTPNRTYAKINK